MILPLIAANLTAGAAGRNSFCMLEVSDSLILAQQRRDFPITKAIFMFLNRLGDGPYIASPYMGVWGMASDGDTGGGGSSDGQEAGVDLPCVGGGHDTYSSGPNASPSDQAARISHEHRRRPPVEKIKDPNVHGNRNCYWSQYDWPEAGDEVVQALGRVRVSVVRRHPAADP